MNYRSWRALGALGVFVLGSQAALADGVAASRAWIRATPPGSSVAAAYLVLENHGANTEQLIEASSDVAPQVSAHVTQVVDGVMQMNEAPLVLAPHARTLLEPLGSHLMLMGLKAPLVAGSSVTLRLKFDHAGWISVKAAVLSATASGP